MRCPRCKSENVSIQVIQTAGKTKTKKTGCLPRIGRALLIFCTCGLWLVFGKKKATSKTTFDTERVAICQNCGHQFRA